MISYRVFDPDDGSGFTYRWYGESMVYVHQGLAEVDAFEIDSGVDAPPTVEAVSEAVAARHAAR